MTKSILELCQSLPDSEPELRARADKFAAEIAERVMGWRAVYLRANKRDHGCFIGGHYTTREACAADCIEECEPVLFWANASGDTFGETEDNWNPLVNIADAKAATDAMRARLQVPFQCAQVQDKWRASFYLATSFITALASTEPLARSAAAYLAAMAMSKSE